MIHKNAFNDEEIRQRKNRFWISWVILNALGTSLGWFFGEYFGQLIYRSYGERAGVLTAALLFEAFIWLGRLSISRYFTKQSLLKFLDILIWIVTEVGGWIMFDFFTSGTSSGFLALQAAFINSMGATIWVLFASIGLLKSERKRNPKNWMGKAFTYGLIGFLAGNIVISFITTTSMIAGEYVGKFLHPYWGWTTSGLILGGLLAVITGFILTKSIVWTEDINF